MCCELIVFLKKILFKNSPEVFVPIKNYFYIIMCCESIIFDEKFLFKNSLEILFP